MRGFRVARSGLARRPLGKSTVARIQSLRQDHWVSKPLRKIRESAKETRESKNSHLRLMRIPLRRVLKGINLQLQPKLTRLHLQQLENQSMEFKRAKISPIIGMPRLPPSYQAFKIKPGRRRLESAFIICICLQPAFLQGHLKSGQD